MADREADAGPDRAELRELAARVDRLAETAAELRELGEEHEIPAVERNARRVEDVVEVLKQNVPEELIEE